MDLTTWTDVPIDKIQKFDAAVRKNYLTEFEKYRIVQDRLFRSDFDRFVELEAKIERNLE